MGSDRREAIDLATVCVHKIRRKIRELEGLKEELESRRGERVLKDVPKEKELIFALVSRITGNHPGAIELARYLRNDEHFSPFEKILWSSDAFHGVTAYRELGIYDDGRLREKAEYCIGELERQIGLFCRLFPDVGTGLANAPTANWERSIVTGGNRSPLLGNADDAEWSEMAAIGDGLL
jgi:hypothetical protein